jgi:pimeloyl-ACP methyl ester carboxylesterase
MTTAASVLLMFSVVATPVHAQGTSLSSPDQAEPYAHPQKLVEIAPGRRLNFYCTGSGSPTVVMDTGFGASAWMWYLVQPAVARLTRVCTYDRAGEGWSDLGPFPRTSSAIVADLHAALGASGESPPYVLVGHSFGGLNMTLYTYLHRDQIVGLVEVDPAVAGQEAHLSEKIPALGTQQYEFNSQLLERLRKCTNLARTGTLKDPAQQTQTGCDLGSAPAAGDYLETRPSQWETLASEAENLLATQPGVQPTDTQEVWAAARGLSTDGHPLGTLPLIVLQAGDLSDLPFSSDIRSDWFQVRAELLDSLAAQSKQGVHVVVPDATHNIPLVQPQPVIGAIRRVVCAAKTGMLSSCK